MNPVVAKTIVATLVVGVLSLACVPSARADSFSFDLTSNNIGVAGSVGSVTISDTGTNQVTITITMNAGFSIKLSRGDVALNGISGLTAGSASAVTATSGMNTFSGLSFNQFFREKNSSQFGSFAFDYANVKGAPRGVVSADTLTFVLTSPGLNG
jgi:hypothetical protein